MELQEQKTLFAERIMRRPNDALMIVANILGTSATSNPMLAITYANEWPNDPFVLSEIKRLKELKPSVRDYIIEMHEKARVAFERGEEKVYKDLMQLILQAEGYLTANGEDGKNDHRLDELAAMVVDTSNTNG